MRNLRFLTAVAVLGSAALQCSNNDGTPPTGTGGAVGSGGATSGGATSGGSTSGGATSGGATSGGSAGAATTGGSAGAATTGGSAGAATTGGSGGAKTTGGSAGAATTGGSAGAATTGGSGGVSGGGGGGKAGGGGGAGGATTGGSGGQGGATVTFAQVATIIGKNCSSCHTGGQHINLKTDNTQALYTTLTSQITVSKCNGEILAIKSDVSKSLLPNIVQMNPRCASRMPSGCGGGKSCLSTMDVDTITSWIAAGAPGP